MVDILGTLSQEMDGLSRSEQRIAGIIFDDRPFAVNASIIELAARAEVSPPTVTRFCRRLGCQSFSEFKVRLAQSAFIGQRYEEPQSNATNVQEVVETILTRAQSVLHSLHDHLDMDAIDAAATAIAKADMVYAFGSGGNSSLFAGELQNRLFRLGLRTSSSNDHSMQLMTASTVSANDVVIGLSISGRNRELVRALDVASGYGAKVITISKPNSLVAETAATNIGIDLAEGVDVLRPSSARFAFLAAIDIVAHLVAIKRKDLAIEPLRRIKSQLVTHRDGDDSQPLGD
ncbi:MurR/RpiR family transcriptional regulator [Maritalea porphyrae]|jgi:DNA-binding MurR/RpiR family transcriptional regulator|uniref:MurR/RpiR family transcriptional regulator n=1 Tax=Maritalea porphyrae TaxID=880732 RepID=UPI0022B04733|nr:MurR/RpiR family transcriptional regulator [Maritalea porphyrae]MCZ4271523.1 MurR/RpiR family transcriptional regulator [Maritalea porphyrae]